MSNFTINIRYPSISYIEKISYKIYERCESTVVNTETIQLLNIDTNVYSILNSYSGVYRGLYFFVDPAIGSGDRKGAMQTLYDALNNTTGSRYNINNNNLLNYTSKIKISNPTDSSLFGHSLIDDGNSTNGYYTELVVNALINSNYNIAPYTG